MPLRTDENDITGNNIMLNLINAIAAIFKPNTRRTNVDESLLRGIDIRSGKLYGYGL